MNGCCSGQVAWKPCKPTELHLRQEQSMKRVCTLNLLKNMTVTLLSSLTALYHNFFHSVVSSEKCALKNSIKLRKIYKYT